MEESIDVGHLYRASRNEKKQDLNWVEYLGNLMEEPLPPCPDLFQRPDSPFAQVLVEMTALVGKLQEQKRQLESKKDSRITMVQKQAEKETRSQQKA